MSGGGGKAGTQTSSQQIDPRLAEGGVEMLASAFTAAGQPYRPNQGASIAAFTPAQQAAFAGANDAAEAFGMPTVEDPSMALPDPEMTASGILGYSSGDQYRENVERSMSPDDMRRQAEILSSYLAKAKKIENMPAPAPAGGGGGK